jgi:hypothetical protein
MATIETNRRLFSWVLWAFVGLCLLVLLTSCGPLDPTAQPAATGTPSATGTIVPTVTNLVTLSPTLTPTPTDKPNKCRIGGRRIADCIRKGMNP